MAEFNVKERLQPALLDRLSGGEHQAQRGRRHDISQDRLQQLVLRDLQWLLNTTNLDCVESLEQWPEAQRSVINFGIANLAGLTASSVDNFQIERMLKTAIETFEPRFVPGSLTVTAIDETDAAQGNNTLAYQISGMLWGQPMPLAVYLRTEIDLELGAAKVVEAEGPQ